MSLTTEEETFVKELARRAKAQIASPAVLIQIRGSRVPLLPEEKRRLDDICAREGKAPSELIGQYL